MPSSATFMAHLTGMALIAGPNQRICFVVRQNTPAPCDATDNPIPKSSKSSSLYALPMMYSLALSRVKALMAAPRLKVVPASLERRWLILSMFWRS